MEAKDDSKFEKSVSSLWEQIDKFSENDAKNELEEFSENNAKKVEKKRVEIKGDIRMIKIGVKNHMVDEIKEGLKYTLDKLPKIIDYFEIRDDQLNGKNNESIIIEQLGEILGDFNEW